MHNRYDPPHLIVSRVALIGGGYLAARSPEVRGKLGMLLAGILGFWFGTRSGNGNGAAVRPLEARRCGPRRRETSVHHGDRENGVSMVKER